MTVVLPEDLAAALQAVADEPDALVLAGGTDAMVQVNSGARTFDAVVALRRVSELRTCHLDHPGGVVRLGAGVTYTRLMDDDIAASVPALAHAARTVGSPQIRNAGTIGGNLGTASPAGDTLPILVALDASVKLASSHGPRQLLVSEFLTGPKSTALEPGELIVAVSIPIRRGPQQFRKVGVRNAMVIAVASVALAIDLDRRTVGVGLGSVGPVALRSPRAEAWIADRLEWRDDGVHLDDAGDLERFGALVAGEAAPIDDHRSTRRYRRHAIGVLAGRCLRSAVQP
jgi:CO/xanthine dehydrogenase FAD-binding subunit